MKMNEMCAISESRLQRTGWLYRKCSEVRGVSAWGLSSFRLFHLDVCCDSLSLSSLSIYLLCIYLSLPLLSLDFSVPRSFVLKPDSVPKFRNFVGCSFPSFFFSPSNLFHPRDVFLTTTHRRFQLRKLSSTKTKTRSKRQSVRICSRTARRLSYFTELLDLHDFVEVSNLSWNSTNISNAWEKERKEEWKKRTDWNFSIERIFWKLENPWGNIIVVEWRTS